ncbi:hypothetical protein APASM_6851 [Actinosynnema pretiosum subsp. pretiosum]|nr:hypothetical protein APASM_6851 [Actinosynnema pretiosum subsp. pretiosum]
MADVAPRGADRQGCPAGSDPARSRSGVLGVRVKIVAGVLVSAMVLAAVAAAAGMFLS